MTDMSGTDESELEDIYTIDPADLGIANETDTTTLVDSRGGREQPLEQVEKRWCRWGRVRYVIICVLVGVTLAAAAVVLPLILLHTPSSPRAVVTTANLNGVWTITNSNGTIDISGLVPGSVHSALLHNHIIDDPYYGDNYASARWIYNDTWLFERNFTVRWDMLRAVHLVCEGLDTIATVSVNGVHVGRSFNQFIRYTYDITHHVKPGKLNHVSISFASPTTYAATESDLSDPPVPPECPPEEFQPECHGNMIRNSQASFGSSWTPAFVTQGIWKDIYIAEFKDCRILDVVTRPPYKEANETTWCAQVSTYVDCVIADATNATFVWQVKTVDNDTIIASFVKNATLTAGEHAISTVMSDLEVNRWWPVRQGDQQLYLLTATVSINEIVVDVKTLKTGFRTVSLVQETLNSGLSFYFEINGQQMFLKGSTWIPPDNIHGTVDKTRIRRLMEGAVKANMNVLRVPGASIYESDYFYELADEYGLLVWQDFMFASALYPGTKKFEGLVRKEVNYQLRRLLHHPCIIVWAGNDQVEQAIFEKWYDMGGNNYQQYKDDYKVLFNDVIKSEVQNLTSVPFLTSSPSNGKLSQQSGGISEVDPNSSLYGDVNSHQFLKDCFEHNTTVTGRFVSKYGWQSWPSFHSLLTVATPADLIYGSPFFLHRQRNIEAGNGTDQMIHRLFNWTAKQTRESLKQYIYLTQLIQGLCLAAETDYLRVMRASDIGTMGAISWQLNDQWPAPSGSTLEEDGLWKMGHYQVARALSDVRLTLHKAGTRAILYVINDRNVDLKQYRASLYVYKWGSTNAVFISEIVTADKAVDIKAQNVTRFSDFDYDTENVVGACGTLEYCYLSFQVWTTEDTTIPHAILYPYPFSRAKGILHPTFDVNYVKSLEGNVFEIQVFCTVSAPFVWVEAENIRGWFSENGQTFECSSSPKKVRFHSWQDNVTNETLNNALRFISLADVLLPPD